MDDLALWVIGWNTVGNENLAAQLRKDGLEHVFTYTNFYGSEAENYNYVIRESEKNGFGYILVTDSDVEFKYSQTIPEMYKWINDNPECGSIRPWRKGEPAQSQHYPPEIKYVEDSTAMMFRLNTGIYMDTEFTFTGWVDLDWGIQMERRGFRHYNDRRYPVNHNMDGSNYHSRSSILQAIKKANKLRLDFKWYKVGMDNWKGTEAYNASVAPEERIPSINQLVALSNDDQERFQQSVSVEHNQIWVKDGRINPNMTWRNPILVGYSTREKFQEEHGYS